MSSSEDKDGSKTPKPPDNLDLGSVLPHTQGSAGSDQQHNPDPNQATVIVSQPTTMVTTVVSQTSTTATTTVSQDNQTATTVSQTPVTATTTVSQPSTMATIAVSLQTTATSTVSQSTIGHVTVSDSMGDTSQFASSISTTAGELEAVIDQAFPESVTATPQGLVTGSVLTTELTSDLQGVC